MTEESRVYSCSYRINSADAFLDNEQISKNVFFSRTFYANGKINHLNNYIKKNN